MTGVFADDGVGAVGGVNRRGTITGGTVVVPATTKANGWLKHAIVTVTTTTTYGGRRVGMLSKGLWSWETRQKRLQGSGAALFGAVCAAEVWSSMELLFLSKKMEKSKGTKRKQAWLVLENIGDVLRLKRRGAALWCGCLVKMEKAKGKMKVYLV